MKNKMTALFLSIILTFAICVPVLAAGKPTIELSSVSGTTGDTVDVTVSMSNNPGIIDVTLDVTFDPNVLTLTNVVDTGLLPGALHSDNRTSPYRLSWANDTAPGNYTGNGKMATLTFAVNTSAAGDTKIVLSTERDGIMNFDGDSIENTFDLQGGEVTVQGIHHEPTHVNEKTAASGAKENRVSLEAEKIAVDSNKRDNHAVETDLAGKKDAAREEAEQNSAAANRIILTINEKNVDIFGKTVENDVPPVIRNGRTMLPIRIVAEALGATVLWNEEARKVTVQKDNLVIEILVDSDTAYINGKAVQLDSPAFIENSRTYVPIRFVAEALGAMVEWNEETQQVIITCEGIETEGDL